MGSLSSYLGRSNLLLLVKFKLVNANCVTSIVLKFIVECTHCHYNVCLLSFRVFAVCALFLQFLYG